MTRALCLAAAVLLALGALSCADDETVSTPTPPPTTEAGTTSSPGTGTATAPASSTPSPGARLEDLSLVYVDTARGQATDVYVASHDGANPKLLVTLNGVRRPMDVWGRTLVVGGQDQLVFIDLTSGSQRPLAVQGTVLEGRFVDGARFLYSTTAPCAEPASDRSGTLTLVELASLQTRQLVSLPQTLDIAGIEPSQDVAVIVPRGCDPGVNRYSLISLRDGGRVQEYAAEGCGWVVAAPAINTAIVSLKSCTPSADRVGQDAIVYNYGIAGPTDRGVTAPDSGSSQAEWKLRPGAAEVALGTLVTTGAGPGSMRAGGLYLLDLTGLGFRQVVRPEGAEQFPVQWSSDGRYLLYGIVEAQGRCAYAYVDVTGSGPAEPRRIDESVTHCGVNGEVAGWTSLR